MSDPISLLMADDDADDRHMAREAMAELCLRNELHFVENGEELLDYLNRRGQFAGDPRTRRPGLILLDLNMPKVDGREALMAIKADPALRQIPVVVLTTSKAEEDIFRSYDLGASSFIRKPITFEGLVNVLRELRRYWLQLVELPAPRGEP